MMEFASHDWRLVFIFVFLWEPELYNYIPCIDIQSHFLWHGVLLRKSIFPTVQHIWISTISKNNTYTKNQVVFSRVKVTIVHKQKSVLL